MADKRSKPAAAAEPPAPASKARAEGIDPKAVYVGGESLADRLMPHAKKILIGLGVVAAILAVYFTYSWWENRKKEKATTALMNALNEKDLEVKEPDPDADPPDPDLPPPPRTFATEAERTTATLEKLSHVTGSQRAAVALLEAKLLLDADRAADAKAVYEKAAKMPGLEGVLAREALALDAERAALALGGAEREAGLKTALGLYKEAQPDEEGPRRDVALYNEGRMLALLGDKEGARAAFQKAAEKGDEDLGTTIDMRLTQLDAKDLPKVPKPGEFKKPEPPAETPPAPTATDGGAAPAPAPTPTPAPDAGAGG